MSVTFFEQWYAGSLKIRGYEPVSASGLPVYVYFSGTGTSNTCTAELEFPRQMALRDYVGAWVEYPNHASYPTSCAGVRGKMATVRQGIQAVSDGRAGAECKVLVPIQMGARMRPADWRGCALSARCK